MATILQATLREELDDVRSLMRAFVTWHRRHHAADIELINRYFDEAAFEAELAGLPGKYAPPKGRLLIAYEDAQPAGMVALRDLGKGMCEMKRMFVPEEFRGRGIGRALADRVVGEAKAAGYARMMLDTSNRQTRAIELYERSGFRRIMPYYPLTAELSAWLVFLELRLQ
jgi:ribosomal protein S18 acetylase RimI-like enzyme